MPRLRAQQNLLDPASANTGLGLAGNVQGIAMQADGKLLVAGGTAGLVRLNTDGTTDPSFQAAFSSAPGEIDVQTDGRILATTDPDTQVNGATVNGLVRLNTDGTTDPSFNADAELAIPNTAQSVTLQSDGKILVIGNAQLYNGTTTPGILRLNADGTLDTTFQAQIGLLPQNSYLDNFAFVGQVGLQSDGKIIISGGFLTVDGAASNGFARLNADGSLDTTYHPTTAGSVYLVHVLANDQLLIAGNSATVDQVPVTGLARLNSDGTLDPTFNYTASLSPSYTVVQPDGRILLQTAQIILNPLDDASFNVYTLSRLNADGSADATFSATLSAGSAKLLPQADGTIYLGGPFLVVNGVGCNSVARLNADGSVDTSYVVDTSAGFNGHVTCLAAQADGKVLAGGQFTAVNGVSHVGVVRLNSDGTLDDTFGASAYSVAASYTYFEYVHGILVQSDGKVLLSGAFTQIDGAAAPGLARVNADGSLDTAFNPVLESAAIVEAVALQADGKVLVAGGTVGTGPVFQPFLVRLNTDGSVDASFSISLADGNGVSSLAVQADGKILAGGINLFGGAAQDLVRLNSDGSVDTGFAAAVADSGVGPYGVRCLAIQADGKILIGGDFSMVDGMVMNGFSRLNADGSVDTSFNAYANGTTAILAEADGTIVIGGTFVFVDNETRNGLAHLNADGTLDPFLPLEVGVTGTGSVAALAQQPDGRLVVGGHFTSLDGVAHNQIARFSNGGTPAFFAGNVSVGSGFYYLQFANGNPFGYYNLAGSGYAFPYFFHDDLGLEYFFDADDGLGGAYLYDFASSTFFYTSPTYSWPYLYDFTLNSFNTCSTTIPIRTTRGTTTRTGFATSTTSTRVSSSRNSRRERWPVFTRPLATWPRGHPPGASGRLARAGPGASANPGVLSKSVRIGTDLRAVRDYSLRRWGPTFGRSVAIS